MKIFNILFLVLLVSCGSGGSGGGSSSGGNDSANKVVKEISNYELRVNGCAGSTFTAIAYTDPDTVDEDRIDWNGSIDGSGTTNIVAIGREIEWEVQSVSGNCQLNMVLTRTTGAATAVYTDSIPNNGQSGYVQDY